MKTRTLILIMVLLICPLMARADLTLTLSGPAGSVPAGSTFWLDVKVTGAVDLWAYQFSLTFPAGTLAAVGAANGTFLPPADLLNSTPMYSIPILPGSIEAVANTLTGGAPGVTGDGLLARVQFMALADGAASIVPYDLMFLDYNLDQVAVTGDATSVTVEGTAPVPEPSAAVLLITALAAGVAGRCRARR